MAITSLVTGYQAAQDLDRLEPRKPGNCGACGGRGLIHGTVNVRRNKPFHHPRSGRYTVCAACNGTGNGKEKEGHGEIQAQGQDEGPEGLLSA